MTLSRRINRAFGLLVVGSCTQVVADQRQCEWQGYLQRCVCEFAFSLRAPGSRYNDCPPANKPIRAFRLSVLKILFFLAMRILSGIQPSGALHLGNYFGMMRPAIELQEKGEAFYFIADYHSMTSLFDPAERRKNTLDVALDFLACGLDPKKSRFLPPVRRAGSHRTDLDARHAHADGPAGARAPATRTRSPRAFRPTTASLPTRCSWPRTS